MELQTLAKRILDSLRSQFTGQHHFRQVSLADYPHLNHRFYHRTDAALRQIGFEFFCDLEDETIRQQHPDPRTVVRLLHHLENGVTAAIYHVKPKFPWPILMYFWGFRPSRILEFETELSDGRFILTTRAPKKSEVPMSDQVIYQHVDPKLPMVEHLKTHWQQVQSFQGDKGRIHPVILPTVQAIIDSQNRQHQLVRDHLDTIGWVTEEYLLGHCGRNKQLAKDVYQEIQRILRLEAFRGN